MSGVGRSDQSSPTSCSQPRPVKSCAETIRSGSLAFVESRRDGRDVAHVGTYLEIDRPRGLVFAFLVEGASG